MKLQSSATAFIMIALNQAFAQGATITATTNLRGNGKNAVSPSPSADQNQNEIRETKTTKTSKCVDRNGFWLNNQFYQGCERLRDNMRTCGQENVAYECPMTCGTCDMVTPRIAAIADIRETPSKKCVDRNGFWLDNQFYQGCERLRDNLRTCQEDYIAYECPVTCGTCDLVAPRIAAIADAPAVAPTITSQPSLNEMQETKNTKSINNRKCVDRNGFWLGNQFYQGCDRLYENLRTCQEYNVAYECPVTCGTCPN